MDLQLHPRWPRQLADPEHLPQDRRNLIDHFKYWREEAIVAELDQRRHPLVLVCENLGHDFNLGTVVRNANAFLAREVWICGRKQWNRRGAVGTHRYQHIHHSPDIRPVLEQLRQQAYCLVAVDQTPQAQNLHEFSWPERTAMLVGQESIGLSPWALAACDHTVYIPQWGSTRSLNVGVAAGIAMNSWAEQHAGPATC